jgi:hypothetical protein
MAVLPTPESPINTTLLFFLDVTLLDIELIRFLYYIYIK